ncbi:hypothetical protein WJ22_20840 [Burkholderia vietnamiensis]|nr:hypothetical protein WJ18_11475 [Burkholderia vietnamiensis]KVF85551.1 hypothetical protein WJ19_14830 [Burkholderia vietnamiensis]KVF94172.1 hypothetical protein WJ20_03445 [Burkholderia vietnamiensis]KVF98128.1 hypothetical protein WJ22_20840 [Burkholderia vietnamiensis]
MQASIGVFPPHLNLEVFRPRPPAPSLHDARGLVVLEGGRVVALNRAARALGSPACAAGTCFRSRRTR